MILSKSNELKASLRGTEVEWSSSEFAGSDVDAVIIPSLFRCEYLTANDSLIIFGLVFSVVIGGEVQSTVTIFGIGLIGCGDEISDVSELISFGGVRGGLCAASRVLFGRIVRMLFKSDVTGSIYELKKISNEKYEY